MALSGSLSTNKYSGIMGLKFSWTAGAQSVMDNETPINWTLESDGGSGYSYYTGNLTLTIDGSIALSIPSKFLMHGGGAWKRTGTLTLKHNDDGKRRFSVSIAAGIYTYGAVNCTASTTFTIDQIKRRSVISGSDGTLGSSNTLTLTRYNSAFTDTITAICGTASMTIATGNTASSVKWTPPVAWAAQNVSATSVTVTISCKTYSGSTLLGETTTTLTFAIPASVVPTVSLAVSDAKGYLAAYGSYIQNKSQAKVTASGEGVYDSTIQRYSVVCGSLSGTGASGTFDLPKSGTITIKVTATDSRGRSASASIDIEVTAYSAPVAEITSRYRCDADGNEDYLGAYAIAVFNAAVTSLGGKNSAAYALKYRIRGTAAWTSIAMDALTGNYAPAVVSQMFPADIDYSYDICVETTDNFGTVESAYRTIQMGSPIMDADRNNRALAFFQRAVDADTIAFGEYVKFNAGTSLDGVFAPIINRGVFTGDIDVVDNANNLHMNSVVWVGHQFTANVPYADDGFCETWAANSTIMIQRVTFVNSCARCLRFYYNDKWHSWYWVNPPMVAGIEYLTTKVWKGSHVYVKMIDCGTLPSYGTAKRVAHGCSFKEVVDFRLIVNGTAIVAMEVGYNNAETIKTFLENTGNIVIDNQMTSSAIDSSTAKAVIEYVK